MAETGVAVTTSKYQPGLRRMLVDMHIPDWDAAFLSKYDPAAMAERFEQARLNAVMIYCKSHAGLCYWPTKAGRLHAGLHGRDVVGELAGELRRRDIAVCAYYSIVFDNWAVETHPDWRQRTIAGNDYQGLLRYGWCCQNHPEYRAYEMAQLGDLLSRYQFDALFLDMIFWPIVCACEHCRDRFRAEAGKEIPETVDWTSAVWCEFQAARERWASEFTGQLMAQAKATAPGIAVTHNLAPALANWVLGQPLSASKHDTFVAGDLYGDRVEQLIVSRMMLHLTETRPAEFMTSCCVNLGDHVRLRDENQMRAQASAAIANSSAFLFIDAIDPIGTVNPATYERVGRVFAATQPYESFIGGEPIEDVAVYFSWDSQMDFAENGTPLGNLGLPARTWPHLEAMRGACRALQRAHLPFGVITRKQLGALDRFRAVVLPNVLRMDREEAEALRGYVRNGGRLYASRYTSLVETAGARNPDFMLADVFGANYAGEEAGAFVYLKPADASVAKWIAPQQFLSCAATAAPFGPPRPLCGIPRLMAASGRVLATLTVPYGYPSRGSVLDHQWASIHSSPPWQDLDAPMIVRNDFGKGRAVYSAAGIESLEGAAAEHTFLGLIRMLLDDRQSFSAETHPSVWMSAFDQNDRSRVMASFLNYQPELPPVPVPVRFSIRPPAGRRFTKLRSVPQDRAPAFTIGAGGVIHAELDHLELLAMVIAEYE
jgi:hypothetical protein